MVGIKANQHDRVITKTKEKRDVKPHEELSVQILEEDIFIVTVDLATILF